MNLVDAVRIYISITDYNKLPYYEVAAIPATTYRTDAFSEAINLPRAVFDKQLQLFTYKYAAPNPNHKHGLWNYDKNDLIEGGFELVKLSEAHPNT